MECRFDRNERLFGKDGQARIRDTTFAVAGCGGLGSHVVQQLAHLGAGGLILIEDGEAKNSNRNRYIGLYADDPTPGSWKVDIAQRLANRIDPSICIEVLRHNLISWEAFEAIKRSDVVLGCFDDDGARFVLNELCLAYEKPLIDLASDAPEPGVFGGRVTIVHSNNGCLFCRVQLSQREIRRLLSPQTVNENEDRVYGIPKGALEEAGPSVVFVNGVIASLGVQEASVLITGIREPFAHLEFRGHEGILRRRVTPPSPDCPCCAKRGQGIRAGVESYLQLVRA